jgi:hypothetical protein
MGGNLCRNFLHFALAGIGCRIGTAPWPAHLGTDCGTGRFGKQPDFFKLFSHVVVAEIKLDDHRTFASGGTFKHSGALCEDQSSRGNQDSGYLQTAA